jgi:excisionase family DNA binding protein
MRLLTPKEAAEFLGLQVDTVYKKSRLRELPSVKVGRALRFDVVALIATLSSTRSRTLNERRFVVDVYSQDTRWTLESPLARRRAESKHQSSRLVRTGEKDRTQENVSSRLYQRSAHFPLVPQTIVGIAGPCEALQCHASHDEEGLYDLVEGNRH